jgi:cell division inhibitor SepF
MSGAMRKMGVYLGLLEDADGEYAELDAYDEPVARVPEQPTRPVSSIAERRRTVSGPERQGAATAVVARASAPLSRITTLHPRTYNEARVIG